MQIESRSAALESQLVQARGILHLGAHLGQEAERYQALGKPALWIEAMPDIFQRLEGRLKAYPGQIACCALLADRDGDQRIFRISNNDQGVSSSLFDFGEYANGDRSLWPELDLKMIRQISLQTRRLDSLIREEQIQMQNYDFWVVDLQGAELLALRGAGNLIKHCRAMLVEVSTVPVYAGGVLWDELEAFLRESGFAASWAPAKQHDDVLFSRTTLSVSTYENT